MDRQTSFQIILLICVFAVACSSDVQKQSAPIPSTSEGREEVKSPIRELKQLYSAAPSAGDRRAICLRAIDEQVIRRLAAVSQLDAIFGSDFSSKLPQKEQPNRRDQILFSPQTSVPQTLRGMPVGVADVGWYLEVEFDSDGKIQDYYLSNLHKGGSRRTDGKTPLPVEELKRLYDAAKSEIGRREVGLRAIDEGVIQTFGPVGVSTVDAIFSTHLASNLPKEKDLKRTGLVDFVSPSGTVPQGQNAQGWFMAVEYYHDGDIANYYLTNVRK